MAEQDENRQEHTVVFLVTPGDILDERWLIESRIGQGAMGSVFRGKDLQQPRKVAIKILAPEHCRKPKVLARFEREAKLMTTLRHPNIIQLYGVGRRGALPYIVMQYLEGMTLSDVVKTKGGKLTPGESLWVLKQIAAGLSFVHHHGLVHRDIKPQNVFVGPGGRVTILDLGVVRDKSNPGLTKPGAMVGTPYYMSPEQIQGTDEIDKRTDVYALAAMTFELLVGRPPFLGTTNFEVLYAHKNNPVPDAAQLNKSINKHVAQALSRGLAKKRDDRPQSASEFYADLEAFIGVQEKVDPLKAFAFLDEAAAAARTKEKKKDQERKKSTRAPTVQLSKPDLADVPPPKTGRDDRPGPPVLEPVSGEVPMALSGDVQVIPPTISREDTRSVADARPSDTMEGDGPPVTAETVAGAPADQTLGESSGPRLGMSVEETAAVSAAELHGRMDSPRDTDLRDRRPPARRPDAEAPDGTGEADPDPGQTVTETGELRVVTTLRGLTSSAQLFIDGKPEGNTPRSVQVPVGRHVVRVERAGFKPLERNAVVQANQVCLVRVELGPAR